MKIHTFCLVLLLILGAVLLPGNAALAQGDLPQDLIKKVGFDQKLDTRVPLDITFTDSTGQQVQLGDYFGDKPVILTLGYYECPMLCSLVRNGLFNSLKELDFTVGEDFEVVVVSIDPTETPEVAETKRRASIIDYERGGSDEGWNFLVGEQESIQRLAEAIGFRYAYDPRIEQYVHPSGVIVLTPEGRTSRYFYGIEFAQRNLRLGLVEASENKIGSAVDQFLLTCYHYDPVSGEYTLMTMNLLRIFGGITVVVLGIALFIMLRNEKTTLQSA